MRELEGRSYAEIAEILDVSTSAVETLIFRARRALREQLEGSLTCGEAEFAISRQLDGRLSRQEKAQLRAHLRECAECAAFARRQRAQRGALKTLALVPVPSSVTSLFGGGGTAIGTGLAVKAAAAVTAGLVIGGASYEGVRHTPWKQSHATAAAPKNRDAAVADVRDAVTGAAREHAKRVGAPATTKAHGAAAKAGAKHNHQNKGHGNGRGREKTRYAGDASVAARHVKVAAAPHPVHPTAPARTHRKPKHTARPKKPQLPGPFDTKPPGKP